MKIIAIGDNVCDKYLSRGKMYPGGQCINTCAYVSMNGIETAYLGKFGNDEVAQHIQSVLKTMNVDLSHCRHLEGENGFACVTLQNNDRVFVGSNHGGVAKDNPYNFTDEDFEYIDKYDLIYTNLNAYIEQDLPALAAIGVPIAFDFSNRWTDEYLRLICPHIKIAILSCAHLDDCTRIKEMKKVEMLGVPIVLGTVGENGSYLLYKGKIHYAYAVQSDAVIDTMGAGDSYFATFLSHLIKSLENGQIKCEDEENMLIVLKQAMKLGAEFSAKTCCTEGAFGYGIPIVGRVIQNK